MPYASRLTPLLKQKSFWLGAAGIALVHTLALLFSTPLYDHDTNSFIRGGLDWDIYHNPFENIFLALAGKITKIPQVIVCIQVLVFAFAASFFAHVLFSKRFFLALALCVAAIEPVNMFYNFSFLPES